MASLTPEEIAEVGRAEDRLAAAYDMMVTVRAFEEAASAGYRSGEMPGAVHVSIGQEPIAAALSVVVAADDALFSTHRGHGHCLAKGMALEELFAELLALREGCSGARGGSMHLFSDQHRVFGTNGVVGPNIALGVGHALAAKRRATGTASVVLFGEGAAGTGTFHEALQLASLWQVPVVMICENNSFSEFTPFRRWATFPDVSSLATRYRDIQVFGCDGSDLVAMIATLDRAFRLARDCRPVFVEAFASRMRGHYEGDPQKYRNDEPPKMGGDGDPIRDVESQLVSLGFEERTLREIAEQAAARVEQALEVARRGSPPDPATLLDNVYST